MKGFLQELANKLDGIKLNKEINTFIELIWNDEFPRYYMEPSITEDMLESDEYADFAFLAWLNENKKESFKKKIIIFAYCPEEYLWFGFWKKDNISKIDDLPIIAIGDNGNFAVIAKNINEFLTLLDRNESIDLKNIKHNQDEFRKEMLSFATKGKINHKQMLMDFADRLANSNYFYYAYAGCSPVKVKSIYELEDGAIDHEHSEFIVLFDERAKNRTYQIEDHFIQIATCRLKMPERFGIDYDAPSKPLAVDTKTLLTRYRELAYIELFWYDDIKYIDPFKIFESLEELKSAYANEKQHFIDDPYLALYWLVFYGLHFDSRYEEVKDIVIKNELIQKLNYLKEPIEFFEKNQDVNSFKKALKDKVSSRFFEKLSYDMWLRYLYDYRGGIEHYNQWLITLELYTKADEYLIRKVRWIKNNFEEYKLWDRLEDDYTKIEDIPLTSYIQASNPLLDSKTKEIYAHKFVEELLKYKNIYNSDISKKFAHTMLEDIEKLVKDKELYSKAIEYYLLRE